MFVYALVSMGVGTYANACGYVCVCVCMSALWLQEESPKEKEETGG